MDEIATQKTWHNHPTDNPKRIEVELQFSEKQFLKLIRGLIPEQMEDKWFIFYEDTWLYFHRSWTGFGIYKAKLEKSESGYSIKEFWVERNQAKYQNDNDNEDIQNFTFLIAKGLLGIDAPQINSKQKIQSESDALKNWSIFGNLIFTKIGIDIIPTVKSLLFGVSVGDALGVPVEFKSRKDIQENPVTGMRGFGTYNLPAGTFSDDSSLTFCLAEALIEDFELENIGNKFIDWLHNNYWTPRGKVFDVGMATSSAISRLSKGTRPDLAGGFEEGDNGNGSLMRILPLVLYIKDKKIEERYQITKQVSSITHGHIRSVIACFYYLEFARQILLEKNKFKVYINVQKAVGEFINLAEIKKSEIKLYDRLLTENIYELSDDRIFSSGYVLHTLEASIWCLMTTDNYKAATLKAVNLGNDTDTTGAVTGGLAGLLYGFENIPKEWINEIARKDEIENLAERLAEKFTSR
jgi:ADP-ribosyl-[dinitrogen reductase] hydrolase